MSRTLKTKVTIANRLGMHARPAMMFVTCASEFSSDITVWRTDIPEEIFDGKSIMQVMMLAATQDTEIAVAAKGADAKQAVRALVDLVKSGFNEE